MNGFEIIDSAYRLKRTQDKKFKEILKAYSLRQSDLDVLLCLHSEQGCQTAGAVAEARMLPKSLVSASVVTLAEQGLIECRADKNDRRRTLLSLTGNAFPIIQRAEAITDSLFEGLTEDDILTFLRCMEQMTDNLNECQ